MKTVEGSGSKASRLYEGMVVGGACFLGGLLAHMLSVDQVALLQPLAGIAFAAILLRGPRVWPFVWAAAVLVDLFSGRSPPLAAVIGAGSALNALAGAGLMHLAGFRLRMDRVRDAIAFAVLGVTLSPLPATVLGATTLSLSGTISWGDFGGSALSWWAGDAAGVLFLTPGILAIFADRSREGWPATWRLEAIFLASVTVFVTLILFGGSLPVELAGVMLLLPFPLLLWGAFRFGFPGASIGRVAPRSRTF